MRFLIFTAACLLVLGVFARPAHGTNAPHPWFSILGTGATYTMTDVNGDVAEINAFMGPFGPHMHEVRGGFGFGAAAGLDGPSPFNLGIAYERIIANTTVGDATGSLHYHLPADLLRGIGEYRFQQGRGGSFVAGVSAGAVIERGRIEVSETGFGAGQGELRGSAPLFELYLGGERSWSDRFAFTGQLGYRNAKIDDLKIHDVRVLRSDGTPWTIDYSGVYVRAALKLFVTN